MSSNKYNVFTGVFYFGSSKVKANLIFDTSSDWVFVMDKQCMSCAFENRKYEWKESTSS